MIMFPLKSANTSVFTNPSDATGVTISNFRNFQKWSHRGRLQPWVLHAPGAMMTAINMNSLKSYYIIIVVVYCIKSTITHTLIYKNACRAQSLGLGRAVLLF